MGVSFVVVAVVEVVGVCVYLVVLACLPRYRCVLWRKTVAAFGLVPSDTLWERPGP